MNQKKKEINEEGFDENAAVIIGKEEEMPRLLEKLEKEGYAENLATYLKMHKEIAVPKDEITEKEYLNAEINLKSGLALVIERERKVIYIDKDGNIAKVQIYPEKITDQEIFFHEGIEKQLDELGFTPMHFHDKDGYNDYSYKNVNPDTKGGQVSSEEQGKRYASLLFMTQKIRDYQKQLAEKEKESGKEVFDF